MSDFDKEAERERLREKYERDQEKREATEQMSELLLQGATMTNAHCSECNDPIFRYDGQEFCATCERPVDRDTGDEEGSQSGSAIEVTSPSDEAHVKFGGDDETADASRAEASNAAESQEQAVSPQTQQRGASDDAGRQSTGRRDQPTSDARGQSRHNQPATDHGNNAPRQNQATAEGAQQPSSNRRQPTSQSSQAPGRKPSRAGGSDADIGAVRESLVQTLGRFSEQAETCEDPQRAREYLAAAREAAETLEALRR
ncbi:Sjogren's syndrome/scleroderma autoantigen 1 family protein [Halovenus rubra]|uniref:Sjogren's syndrome/scleroderma autoantigen 1 family protein n=2 Tax=Halovenus rubra TaxID=869890 RepID=A0ABD5XET2_9EURY|nr:Sjogren's syndrome/scleroderma autoantigen 1 family protein [Halovenus rubra]